MLEVRKGKSSKSYENEFFRKLSKELSQVFEKREWNGILLGMPECNTREDLQIDCLLVTENQIIIIDFKDYSGTLELPIEEDFKFGRWTINGDVTVKGGSSPNPFSQLGKQRVRLLDELKYRLHDFDRKSISTMVCFHNKVEIIGEIPREFKVGFSVVDSTNYLNKIVDIMDVLENKRINYLSENSKKVFIETLFNVDEYLFDVHVESELTNQPLVETSKVNTDVLQQIREFLESDCKIMTLIGNTGSGKTALIPDIRELAFDSGFTDVPVFAYSNRLRRKMLKKHPNLEEVESLFNSFFDFNNEAIDEFYRKIIPLRGNDEIHDQEKAIYIIDDSQLISNTDFDTDLLKFGSGHLLDDILNQIDLAANPNRKIIFIGDRNKLSYGSPNENALHPVHLKTLLENKNLHSEVMITELPYSEGDSEIIKVCNTIAKNIRNNQYNELIIHSNNEIYVLDEKESRNALVEAVRNPYNNKILVFTNEQAFKINHWIKKNLVRNGNELAAKDHIVFNSTINAYGPTLIESNLSPFKNLSQPFSLTEPKRVDNGYFGEVISVNLDKTIVKHVDVNKEKVILRFTPCQIKLQDETIIETLVLENYLKSTQNKLLKEETIAIQIILSHYEKLIFDEEPFESSFEFQEMMQHPNEYMEVEKEGKQLYRNPKDKRKLTHYEKEYRKRLLRKLNNPNGEYWKILNASKVKYAWAMTVHKAMAYAFDTVFFNTDQEENRGRTNKEYFKWIYTGISVGLHNVNLINWKPISPFLRTEFREGTNVRVNKDVILNLSNGEESSTEQVESYLKMQLNGVASIININPRPYLEIVTLEMNNRNVELFFDYNGRGEIKVPRFKSGTQEDYQTILQLLKPASNTIPNEVGVMKSFFEELIELFRTYDIQMKLIQYHEWNLIFNFSKNKIDVNVQIWYNNDGMISNFLYNEGSNELYFEIVELIKEIYILC
ncbi:hypothetical protein BFM98_14055 [Lysinibacillus sp. AR18-8]|uniref:nuclease-related domain-containing protein n=1 Tax=Lysinibacillus sp. AR18-8 TaxID=1889781 RepID=UPI000824D0B7|nr:nuclease-related domain-containing protein [Lysinibacillus sp. AR18-8]OCX63331.1 hypothetical protein BFM98_14055 [Lysinibacillus sp. AR18-8]